MPIMRDLSAAQIAFQIAGESADQFLVTRYRGTEGLCRLYRFDIDVVCDDTLVEFDALVGRACVLSVNTNEGGRWFHGIVGRLELTNETVGQCYYRIEMVPAVWTLTHRYSSRIFQNKSTIEIIEEVLHGAGVSGDKFRVGPLEQTYAPREFCVQYRETDFNFICRLMEEEGIWWYFDQREDGHVLVLADSTAAYQTMEGGSELTFRSPTGFNIELDHVSRFSRSQAVRPGAVVLRDYSFESPRLDLESRHDLGRDGALEFSDYPGEYDKRRAGDALARLRTEEFEAGRVVAHGRSNCPRLRPACKFELFDHPSEKLNGEYLLTAVTHVGRQSSPRTVDHASGRSALLDPGLHQSLIAARQSDDSEVRRLAEAILQVSGKLGRRESVAHQEPADWLFHGGQVSNDLSSIAIALGLGPREALSLGGWTHDSGVGLSQTETASVYECQFECIPATVVYRPSRVTPWPVMRGSQTARVVGPEGEEIHTDPYGRVKVQFNWDRQGRFDERSSCWIRVSQGSAGGQYGMMFLPRVGQEVIVDFLEGDPDRPIITGRVYNADQMPPYALPAEKTKSVIKTNSTPDGGGANEIRFEDLKDSEQILVHAQKDLHIRANHDRVTSVDRDDHISIAGDRIELISKSRHSEVRLDALTKIGGKRLTEVAGDVGEEFKSNHSEKVAGAYHLKAGRKIVIDAGEELTLKVGGNFIKIDAGGVTILGKMVKINSGGSAGSASLVGLKAPKRPLVADTVKPGADVHYSDAGDVPAGGPIEAVKGRRFRTSWIEVEVVDEEGRPVVGEAVDIIGPEGEPLHGITGADGVAHILVPKPGDCGITFPNLDGFAWEQLS